MIIVQIAGIANVVPSLNEITLALYFVAGCSSLLRKHNDKNNLL